MRTGISAGRYRRTVAIGVALAAVGGGIASAATVTNGSFSDGLNGWSQVNDGSGAWQAVTFTGPNGAPLDGFTIPVDTGQTNAAGTFQSGPGDHFLYQDIALEPNQSHKLSLDYRWQNNAGFVSPASLSMNTFPNQQARIDVIKPTAPIGSIAASDILGTVVATTAQSPSVLGWTQATADLSQFAGQTVRLRLAEVDNEGNFTFDVANIVMTTKDLTSGVQTVTQVVQPGQFGFVSQPGAVVPKPVKLTGKDLVSGPFTLPLDVDDATGSGNGWSVSLATTPFTNPAGKTIAGPLLETSEGAVTCDAGATCTNAADAHSLVSTSPIVANTPTIVRVADAATGMGDQSMAPSFTLAVPANNYAGTFTSTWTVTIANGPSAS